jgi:hypothetical protein
MRPHLIVWATSLEYVKPLLVSQQHPPVVFSDAAHRHRRRHNELYESFLGQWQQPLGVAQS